MFFAVFFALTEGVQLFGSIARAREGLKLSASVGLESAALLALPVLAVLLPCAFVRSRRGVALFVEHWRLALGGGDRERGGLGLIVYTALTTSALTRVVAAGQHAVKAAVSGPDRAPVLMSVEILVVMVGVAIGVAAMIAPVHAVFARVTRWFPPSRG